MRGSMADIQSAAAEIRRGKKEEEVEDRTNDRMKIYMAFPITYRAAINDVYSEV